LTLVSDRLCLALGVRMGLPAAMADAAWAELEGGPRIVQIR
jgi:PIN domain nuclease of toxin-antitoxin system